MSINEIIKILDAVPVTGDLCKNWDEDFQYAFSSDLMSDVLRLSSDNTILITGLCNIQTIRTVEMAEIKLIILARGKKADEAMIELAKENDARFIYPTIGMTLRTGNREYFYEMLDRSFLGIKEKYIKRFDQRYTCSSPKAKKLWNLFADECNKLNIRYNMKDIIADYKRSYWKKQLDLF